MDKLYAHVKSILTITLLASLTWLAVVGALRIDAPRRRVKLLNETAERIAEHSKKEEKVDKAVLSEDLRRLYLDRFPTECETLELQHQVRALKNFSGAKTSELSSEFLQAESELMKSGNCHR